MGFQDEGLLRRTLRHVAVMAGPDQAAPPGAPPFPADWFDLPERLWADLGAMVYLLSLTGYHRRLTLAEIVALLEPPLRLGQYKVFRAGGHPRAFLTWAGLTPEAEYDFAVRHRPLLPAEWNGGTSKWMVDFAAPFGHVEQIIPMLTANPAETRVRTLWHNRAGTRWRILEWSRPPGQAHVDVRSFGPSQFARMVLGG